MEFLQYEKVVPMGELGRRIHTCRTRLSDPVYSAETVIEKSRNQNAGCPGEWEGRTLLARVMMAKVGGQSVEDPYTFLSVLEGHLNSDGYWGELMDRSAVDERQLAGNSWYLRALCELCEWNTSGEIKRLIQRITKLYLVRLNGLFEIYPIDREEKRDNPGGEADPGWRLSSDPGCAFTMIDGASHAYHLLRSARLYPVLVSMIRRFSQTYTDEMPGPLDIALPALRGMIRFYGDVGEPWLLQESIRLFKACMAQGASDPMAVTDLYPAAMELWRHTRCSCYLKKAHQLLYRTLRCKGSLNNAGSASDNGESYRLLREADLLANAAIHMAALEKGVIYLPIYQTGSFCGDTVSIQETSGYPDAGEVTLEITSSVRSPREIRLFCPIQVETYRIYSDDAALSGERDGCFISLSGPFTVGQRITVFMDYPQGVSPVFPEK